MIDEALRFFVERRDYGLYVALHVGAGNPVTSVGKLQFTARGDGVLDPEPALKMREAEAQQLLDELWRAGFRPSLMPEGEGLKAHLADMRQIAFGKLNIEKPEAKHGR